MIELILNVLWFFLPAGIANTAPIIAAKIPFVRDLNYPVDCNISFRNKRLLGDHKTLRGFVTGVLSGVVTACIQQFLYNNSTVLQTILTVDYSIYNPIVLGFLLGFGALFGDSVKSFFKRQIGVASGKSWFPFDQIDYIIGGALFALIYVQLGILFYLVLFAVWFLMHLLFTYIGYILGLKDDPI